jgi:hypothetical protein
MIAAKSNGHRHRSYDELAQLDELHQELISNPEKDIK